MKKLVYLLLMSATALSFVACGNTSGAEESDTTRVSITPEEVANVNQVGAEQSIIGVAIDAAMNSVLLLTPEGDSVMCSYPDLPPAKRASWNMGDTITVKKVKLKDGTDSVTAILKGVKP